MGDDGGVLVLPRHQRPPPARDPPRGLPLPADRAPRRHRHPARLRRPAGRHRRLHLRGDACRAAHARLGVGRFRAGARGLRRQGRHAPAARLAAGSASRSPLAGLGPDERRDAQDRRLRPAARDLRSARHPDLVVGRARHGAGARHRALRRRVQRGADRHEAPARLVVGGEHRLHPRRLRARGHLPRLRHGHARRPRAHGGALSLPEPRGVQEPALPRHRLGAARHPRAGARQAGRPHPPHALGGLAHARGHARHRRPAAVERLRLGVAAAAGLPLHARPAAGLPQHAGAGGRRGGCAHRRARRLRDGEVLRRGLPRPAPRGEAPRGPRLRSVGAHRAHRACRRLRGARCAAGRSHRRARPRHPRPRGRGPRRRCRVRQLALPRAGGPGARELQPRHHSRRHRPRAARRVGRRPAGLPRRGAPGPAVGLRLSAADPPHAGHGRRLRPARAADLRALLPHATRAAVALRPRSALQGDGRGPALAPAVPAGRAPGGPHHPHRRRAAGRARLDLPALQLPHPAAASALRPA